MCVCIILFFDYLEKWTYLMLKMNSASLTFSTDKLHMSLQITPTPPSLPRKPGAQTCVCDVAKPCTQQRRSSEEEMWGGSLPFISFHLFADVCVSCGDSVSCSVLSRGIKPASAVLSVAKDSSPQPSATETGRSTAKVCNHHYQVLSADQW